VERLILLALTLFGRQWSKLEILIISLTTLFMLVWLTKQQQSKKVQSKYNKDQFLDSSPLIGLKFGAHNKSSHIVNDWKKDRLAPVQKYQNKKHKQKKKPPEKPHEEIKQLQSETTKHKQVKIPSEQQVSELTAENEKLQKELAKFEHAESQNKQDLQTKEFLEKLQEEIKMLQNETFDNKQAKIRFEQQVTELTTHNEKLQRELDKSKQAESQNKQHLKTLEKLREEIKQLQNEISEHNQAKVSFEQQVSELTAGNEKLQHELAKFEQAESQNKQHLQTLEKLHEEIKQLQNEISEHNQAKVSFEQQVSELTADNEKLQSELANFEQVESQNKQHLQTLEKLQEENKQLQNEIGKHNQAKVSFKQQVSELKAENEKLQSALARFEQAESQITEMTAACRHLQPEETQVEQISEQQFVAEPAVEVPVKRDTTKRCKTYEQQHRTVDGVRQKFCRKCKEWKTESEFHKNSSSKDGLAASCKICKNNAARKSRRRREAIQR
jgi:predicted  nucleic acid-binding Zn-ribbon protein